MAFREARDWVANTHDYTLFFHRWMNEWISVWEGQILCIQVKIGHSQLKKLFCVCLVKKDDLSSVCHLIIFPALVNMRVKMLSHVYWTFVFILCRLPKQLTPSSVYLPGLGLLPDQLSLLNQGRGGNKWHEGHNLSD